MKRLIIFLMLVSFAQADYLGSWKIDDFLTVMETLHDTSGDAVAATGAVHCWVYEDVTAAQIIDEEMAAFDSITGLYEERIELTAVAGFEAAKTYTVLIQATADGVSGINTHTFQILAAVDVQTVSGTAQTGNDNGADINTLITEMAKVPKSDSNVSWNATALGAIEAEAVDALESFNLDKVAGVSTGVAADGDLTTIVVDGSILSHMMTPAADTSTYRASTDSQEALRNHIGDGTNLSEAGGDGAQLTAINLPNQTMDISGTITTVTTAVNVTTVNGLAAEVITAASTKADYLTEINDQVVDVMTVDTVAEMAPAGAPETPTMEEILNYLYRKFMQERHITATKDTVRNWADDADLFDAILSEDGTTFIQQQYITP